MNVRLIWPSRIIRYYDWGPSHTRAETWPRWFHYFNHTRVVNTDIWVQDGALSGYEDRYQAGHYGTLITFAIASKRSCIEPTRAIGSTVAGGRKFDCASFVTLPVYRWLVFPRWENICNFVCTEFWNPCWHLLVVNFANSSVAWLHMVGDFGFISSLTSQVCTWLKYRM